MANQSDSPTRAQNASDETERPTIWLTLTEASDRFDVGRSTLRRRIDDGLDAARQSDDGHGSWLISLDWLSETYRTRENSKNATSPDQADSDALTALIAERNEARLQAVRHAAQLETLETVHSAETESLTSERDRLSEELKRTRSDLEEALIRTDRAHTESAEAARRLEDALGQIETYRSRSEQLAIESSKSAALAAERAAQLEFERAQRDRAAQELADTREDLASAQANARWLYRRRLRRGP